VPWRPDTLLPGFDAVTLRFPDDYDGPVRATLVRRRAAQPSRRAFLYLHGFIDYFFHTHLADECNTRGYDFSALDLRKYGRSLRDAPHPNIVKNVREYYPEISASIAVLTEDEGITDLVVYAHSTGCLIASLYADEGRYCDRIDALVLNSPFFDFALPSALQPLPHLLAPFGRIAPFARVLPGLPPAYFESIHRDYHGEWPYDLTLKPIQGFPVYLGWLRAILRAQQRLRRGLHIAAPVLVMHSARSVSGLKYGPELHEADAVLDVAHMVRDSAHLGPDVTLAQIPGGMHDLALSRPAVRERVFTEMFAWLDSTINAENTEAQSILT
jgi:alpha-beta hydrolase superfamily lysophospholipase